MTLVNETERAAPAALIVGADGLIGEELLRRLRQRGSEVIGTTHGRLGDDAEVHFDLTDSAAALLNTPALAKLRSEKSWMAFLVAAVTGYQRCEQDPIGTRRVNVTNSINLAAELLKFTRFLVYPSSSAVFGGTRGPHQESASPSVTSEYGRQKADAERGMLGLIGEESCRGGVAVARLTKVIAARGMVGKWIVALRSGGVIEAATDLLLCPISSSFAANGLIEIAATGRSGIYHLSGERLMSYFEFAIGLAEALQVARSQVRPIKIGSMKLAEFTTGVALEMAETRKHTSLTPQALDSVLLDLVSSR